MGNSQAPAKHSNGAIQGDTPYPLTPRESWFKYDFSLHKYRFYNGIEWLSFGEDFTPSTLLNDYSFIDNSTDWDLAFSWGDHTSQGYLINESQNLQQVTDIGNRINNPIIIANGANGTYLGSDFIRVFNSPKQAGFYEDRFYFKNSLTGPTISIKPGNANSGADIDHLLQNKSGTLAHLEDLLPLRIDDYDNLPTAPGLYSIPVATLDDNNLQTDIYNYEADTTIKFNELDFDSYFRITIPEKRYLVKRLFMFNAAGTDLYQDLIYSLNGYFLGYAEYTPLNGLSETYFRVNPNLVDEIMPYNCYYRIGANSDFKVKLKFKVTDNLKTNK